jgi:hypothetical protein
MNRHLTTETLARVRKEGRDLILFEPGGLLVTTADLLDEIEHLRALLAEEKNPPKRLCSRGLRFLRCCSPTFQGKK